MHCGVLQHLVIDYLYHCFLDDVLRSFYFANRTANDVKPIIANYFVSSNFIAKILRFVMVWTDTDIESTDTMNKLNLKKT